MKKEDALSLGLVGAAIGYYFGQVPGALLGLLIGYVSSRIIFDKQSFKGLFK